MRRILVVIDRDDPGNPAFARACAVAGENCADLGILRLRDAPEGPTSRDPRNGFLALIAAARACHPCIGSIAVSTVAPNPRAIASAAEAADADLIVLRNRIDDGAPYDAPSVPIDRVVQCTALPVLAVQNPVDAPYRRLVALAGRGAIACQEIELALSMTPAWTKRCDEPGDDAALLGPLIAATGANRPDPNVAIRSEGRDDDVETMIRARQGYRPDLVVAVTHSCRGLNRLFGSSHLRDLLAETPFDMLIQEAAPSGRHEGRTRHRLTGQRWSPLSPNAIPT